MKRKKRPFYGESTLFALSTAVLLLSCPAALAQSRCDLFDIQKLAAPDGEGEDWFGYRIAMSGDTAVVSAIYDDDRGTNSGAAYVFVDTGGGWAYQDKLVPNDGAPSDAFGISLDIEGNTIVVGSPSHGFGGAAYVFERHGDQWLEEAKIKGSDVVSGHGFGSSVAIGDDNILVGTPVADGNSYQSGVVYVFKRAGSVWFEHSKLFPDDGLRDDRFGISVAISNDTAIIGAHGNDDGANGAGSAYIYRSDGDNWLQGELLLANDPERSDYLGKAVAIHGDYAIVGASTEDAKGSDSGAAYIFEAATTGTFRQQAKIFPIDGVGLDHFGTCVAIFGDAAVVGAVHADGLAEQDGVGYVFRRFGTTWVEQSRLLASDGANDDALGASIGIHGSTVISGCMLDDEAGLDSGSACVFTVGCPAVLSIDPDPLIGGQDGTFSVVHAKPVTKTYLVYSTRGPGSVYVPFLDVRLDLRKPQQAGGTKTTDAFGLVGWTLPIPSKVSGITIWFQACQVQLKTNVIETIVQ